MRFGFLASVLFHLCLVGAIVLWGRNLTTSDLAPEPTIPVELITEAELAERTNVPTMRREAEPTPEPESPPDDPVPVTQEIALAEPEPEPAPPAPPAPEPEPPEPEPEPEPEVPEPEPEPEPRPEPVERPKPSGLNLDALADKAREAKDRQQVRDPSEVQNAQAGPVDVDGTGVGRLTASEIALVRSHMQRCWSPPAGAPNAEKLVVTVSFDLNPDGTLRSPPKVTNSVQIDLSGNRYWKVAERDAVRAVIECQPYDFLPADRYEDWKEFEFNFDPSQMVGFQ